MTDVISIMIYATAFLMAAGAGVYSERRNYAAPGKEMKEVKLFHRQAVVSSVALFLIAAALQVFA